MTETSADGGVRPQVMLVDDEAVFLRMGRILAQQAGVDLTMVDSGRVAVERAVAHRFDLILMDVSMPTVDGPGATRMIRRIERESGLPRTPIVALTAHAPARIRGEMQAVGMDDVVAKPITLEMLKALLARVDIAAPVAPPAPSGGVIDLTDLRRLCVTDRDLRELLDAFREGVVQSQRLMEKGLDGGAVSDGLRAAHSLKGLYAQVGGRAAARRMEEIESRIRTVGFDGVVPLWRLSRRDREQVWRAIETFMAEQGYLAR